MGEQTLTALGVHTCGDIIAKRGLLGALYSSVATDYFMSVRTYALPAWRSLHCDSFVALNAGGPGGGILAAEPGLCTGLCL